MEVNEYYGYRSRCTGDHSGFTAQNGSYKPYDECGIESHYRGYTCNERECDRFGYKGHGNKCPGENVVFDVLFGIALKIYQIIFLWDKNCGILPYFV